MTDDLTALITGLAQRAKEASRVLATASTEQKNAVLRRAAEALRGQAGERVLEANAKDMEAALSMGLSTAMLDRLLHHAHILKCGPRSWRSKEKTALQPRGAES